jgi:glycosyltransferase involved in cell wall biosynthesis
MAYHDIVQTMGKAKVLFPLQWDEPFGMVVIEAMAAGRGAGVWPRSMPELIKSGETGYLVEMRKRWSR